MILIIAEKPSLARNIAAGIGNMKKRNGYLENENYLVTWAFGHLFSLCDVEDYDQTPGDGKWGMHNLPCFPSEFRFQLRKGRNNQPDVGIERQFNTIRQLCLREDVTQIVNAGDADREGEIIVRLCIQNTGVTGKTLSRLWLPDQTPETVREALQNMKDESAYDNLAAEGFARTYMDWLYGVNLTRYATLRTGKLLRVGRVIVPIVQAIYERDKAIEEFVPEIYYALVSKALTDGEEVELVSQYKFPKEKSSTAQRACDKLNAQTAVVKSKKTSKTTLNPPKLFSLSKLQNYLGKKYKMSMDDSLRIVQDLYEKGYLTYPRTNSEYLATAEKEKIKTIIGKVKDLGYPVEFADKKTIFDDSKIESHSALTPTYKIPRPTDLSAEEKTVYSTVMRRFAAVFCSEPCKAEKTEMVVAVGECEDYTLKGTVITQAGWTKFDPSAGNSKILPNLQEGDKVNIDFHPVEKKTSPPRHYTIETLNNYLKNPFREDKANIDENADDAEEYRAMFEGLELGTEATRTGIIENAIKSHYIELKKDVYHILPDGRFLIDRLTAYLIGIDKYKTCEMGKALKSIYHGTSTVEEGLELVKKEINLVIFALRNTPGSIRYTGFYGEVVGKCPLCSGELKRYTKSYSCANYKTTGCKFTIWAELSGYELAVTDVQLLIDGKRTAYMGPFRSKAGNEFYAALRMVDGKIVFEYYP